MTDTCTTQGGAVWRFRCTAAVMVAVAISVLAAPDALGATPQSRLGKPVTLVKRTGLNPPMMAASNANGAQAFAWVKFRRKVDGVPPRLGGPPGVVQARLRRASGRLTPVQSLSPKNRRAFVPAIGIDRAGTATAAWLQQVRRDRFKVVVSVRRAGRRFGRAVAIGRTRIPTLAVLYPDVRATDYGAEPALAVAADGSAVVAWRGPDSLQIAVRRRGRCPASARRACFSRPQDFPLGAGPRVVFGTRNRAYVVWAGLRGVGAGIQLAVARVGSPFKPIRVSRAGEIAREPTVAVTPDGSAIVAWYANDMPGAGGVQTAVRSPTGGLSAPLTLSDRARFPDPGVTPFYGGSSPRVVANPQGEGIVVWKQATLPETGGGLVTAVWTGGGFGPSHVVDAVAFGPMMAVDGRGNTVLVHFHGAGGFGDWRVRPPGGAFGPPESPPGSPAFVVKRNRNAVTLGVLEGPRTRLYDVIID